MSKRRFYLPPSMEEGREKGKEHSAPSDISAAPDAANRHNIVPNRFDKMKMGLSHPKVDPIRNSDAVLTFVEEIIHVDHENR
jgi:hypothetical protein